jgi:hypothetical protein
MDIILYTKDTIYYCPRFNEIFVTMFDAGESTLLHPKAYVGTKHHGVKLARFYRIGDL